MGLTSHLTWTFHGPHSDRTPMASLGLYIGNRMVFSWTSAVPHSYRRKESLGPRRYATRTSTCPDLNLIGASAGLQLNVALTSAGPQVDLTCTMLGLELIFQANQTAFMCAFIRPYTDIEGPRSDLN